MPPYLTTEQLTRDLALRDLTDPAAGPHAIQSLIGLGADALVAAWACPPRPSPGPRIVPIADNYDNLGFTAGAASRDTRYTRYVDAERMLRSHSSAMVPPALRALATDPLDDVLLVCPGIVYRRDAIDRLHTGTPHQLDLWRISRRPLTNADMDEMIRLLVDALAPGRRWRAEPRVHPYTILGRQVDVQDGHAWVEVWECGLAHPDVLTRAGLGRLARPGAGAGTGPAAHAPQAHPGHSAAALGRPPHRRPDDRPRALPRRLGDAGSGA